MMRVFIVFLLISFTHADILEREDVQNFVELAVDSSELTKEEIENYLIRAVPSKKAQTARQNQPEVKATWSRYRNRYVTSSRINNGVKFVKENYEILDRNDSVLRIKTCALTGVAVNYTPEGMWSAYEKGMPTSVLLSLRFGELEPIFDTDYEEDPFEYDTSRPDIQPVPIDAIGY